MAWPFLPVGSRLPHNSSNAGAGQRRTRKITGGRESPRIAIRGPGNSVSQLAFEDRETALPPEILLVKPQQIRDIGRNLRRDRPEIRLLEGAGRVAKQVQR